MKHQLGSAVCTAPKRLLQIKLLLTVLPGSVPSTEQGKRMSCDGCVLQYRTTLRCLQEECCAPQSQQVKTHRDI